MFMNIIFHILVTLTSRVTILLSPFRSSYDIRVSQHSSTLLIRINEIPRKDLRKG